MDKIQQPRWVDWAREIQALSQSGMAYGESDYDMQRYQRLMEIAAEIIENHTTLSGQSVLENFRMQAGYATPKVDVRGAVLKGDKILLVQERADGRWCLPGGWADVGVSAAEMAAREVQEESGLEVAVHKVIGVYNANQKMEPAAFYHAYKIIFLCEAIGGEARPGIETMDVGFFRLDDLPPLSSNRTDKAHLREVFAHVEDKDRPAFFD